MAGGELEGLVVDERRKFFGLYHGSVVRRDDPEGRMRVKVRVPGLIEPESPDWALPLGVIGGGHAQSGGPTSPPPNGANVAILFEQGEIDKPNYLAGPWGAPGGVSDAPTGGAVEGDDRQNAVIEDQEWIIERDSRASAQVHRIKHKASGAEIVIKGTDRVELGRDGADEALVLGTSYRVDEAAYLTGLHNALETFAADVAIALNVTDVAAAGGVLSTALGLLTSDVKDDATAYISEKVFTE